MNREKLLTAIGEKVRRLDREQLLALQRLLDRLEGRPENPTPEQASDPEAPESEK